MGKSDDVDIPLSDTFIFSCFLISYMKEEPQQLWIGLTLVMCFHLISWECQYRYLLLIAIMTFVLITSSGTMALAVKYGYENRKMCGHLILATAIGGLILLECKLLSGLKLIHDRCETMV